VLRLTGIVISIGLADSLNPSTVVPALYLASHERPRTRVAEFTLAVFLVYLVGGAIIALGPGRLLISLLPHPRPHLRFTFELIAGAILLAGSVFMWAYRDRLNLVPVPAVGSQRRSSIVLGATITAVELPTAFPYFAAIAAIVGSRFGVGREIVLLVVFNFCFVLPLLAVLVILTVDRARSDRVLARGRKLLEAHWPAVIATLLLLAGIFVILVGATGFVTARRGFLHRLRRLLH
jgi:cytochrome c biogenesis protein CcdA